LNIILFFPPFLPSNTVVLKNSYCLLKASRPWLDSANNLFAARVASHFPTSFKSLFIIPTNLKRPATLIGLSQTRNNSLLNIWPTGSNSAVFNGKICIPYCGFLRWTFSNITQNFRWSIERRFVQHPKSSPFSIKWVENTLRELWVMPVMHPLLCHTHICTWNKADTLQNAPTAEILNADRLPRILPPFTRRPRIATSSISPHQIGCLSHTVISDFKAETSFAAPVYWTNQLIPLLRLTRTTHRIRCTKPLVSSPMAPSAVLR